MRAALPILTAFLCLSHGILAADAVDMAEKTIVGWLEHVVVSEAGLILEAKLDTGADTSSLHAENIHRFRRNGKRMVRFDVLDTETGKMVQLERPLARIARIREHRGDHQSRPVVTMWVCVGTMKKRIEVNLVDRSAFNYPFLLGRSAMEGHVIIDPSRSFTTMARCDLQDMDQ